MTEEEAKSMGDLFPDLGPEAPVISGIAHDRSEALATVRGVPNEPGMAAKVFTELATAGVNVDMIVQAGASVGTADISFTVPESAGLPLLRCGHQRGQGGRGGRWHEDPCRSGRQVLPGPER